MHDDDSRHHHHGPNGHHHPHPQGHNGPSAKPLQWQAPHLAPDHAREAEETAVADLDLVETAFIEGFSRAPDAASFLRLSGIPFVGEDASGNRLHLLRVETRDAVDVGSVVPLLGGAGVRYDPLPGRLVLHRRVLAFVYHDGTAARRLGFAEARLLASCPATSRFDIAGAPHP